jgi:hypothetical protein
MEVGAVRIHVGTVAEARELLAPFLRVTSRKELAQLLGISPRTLRRWSGNGRLGKMESPQLANVMRHLATIPSSSVAL